MHEFVDKLLTCTIMHKYASSHGKAEIRTDTHPAEAANRKVSPMFSIRVIEVSRTKRIQEYVETRCRDNKCLVEGCDKPQRALGNCEQHVQQFYRALRSVPKKKRPELRAKLIEKGRILDRHEIYEHRDDPIDEAIREVMK